ncbi:DUF5723 family protein [Carboxylicivirga taeanensis]|uniref:DUF5723 family protein n=1 Tax=Carboxylicivirga taeanensis TaxID=1416875 RepID=UPI003F6DBD22
MKKVFALFAAVWLMITAQAQENAMTFLKGVPQTTQINPAFRPVHRWYLSMPALGSFKIDGASSGFSYADAVVNDELNLDKLANNLQENNLLAAELSLQVVGFGFKAGKSFFTFDVNQRSKSRLNYTKSLMDLRYGLDAANIMSFSNSDASMLLNTINYTEVAIGSSYPITDKITVGARIKYLMGGTNIQSDHFNLAIRSNDTGIDVNSNVLVRASMPLDIEYNADGTVKSVDIDSNADVEDYFRTGNNGWAFDFGGTWNVIDKLTVGLAFNDIGYIKWKHNLQELSAQTAASYEYVSVSDEDYLSDVFSDIEEAIQVTDKAASFTTGLMGTMNITADYQHRDWLNFGLVSKHFITDGKLIPETTLAVGMSPGSALSTVFSYSMMKGAPANLGLGLAVKAGAFQIYAVTDNINSAFNIEKAKYVNARVGINFVFNRKKKEASETDVVEE